MVDPSSDALAVNDVQSQLNATRVRRIVRPRSVEDVQAAVLSARREEIGISVCGGRHSMGGQQFGADTLLIDMTSLAAVVALDRASGIIDVEAGIEWPELITWLHREQTDDARAWAIREKQTGVDRVTIGGSLASNVHGRGLRFPPIVGDVESFDIVGADARVRTCSRSENRDLFALAIGGYGLFGVIVRVRLRLVPRTKLRRVVEVIPVPDLLPWVHRRIRQGFEYGDCQYATDLTNPAPTHPGVFACYQPVPDATPIPDGQRELSERDWAELYVLARTDKQRAFERYADYYRSTSGQVYWSDVHQLAGNFDGYRTAVDPSRGTEMITEVYVSPDAFLPLIAENRTDFLAHGADITYGTIRFIERDAETFLAWAKESSVCIVCNLHVTHTTQGIADATAHFRRIIDRAIQFGGRHFLTYHPWATKAQLVACYPQFVEFLRLKRHHDPEELFRSDWYVHHRAMFADEI